jgi:hypothetical protein
MGLVFGLLALVISVIVLGLCVIGAISETVRARKDFKRIEEQSRRRQSL